MGPGRSTWPLSVISWSYPRASSSLFLQVEILTWTFQTLGQRSCWFQLFSLLSGWDSYPWVWPLSWLILPSLPLCFQTELRVDIISQTMGSSMDRSMWKFSVSTCCREPPGGAGEVRPGGDRWGLGCLHRYPGRGQGIQVLLSCCRRTLKSVPITQHVMIKLLLPIFLFHFVSWFEEKIFIF